MKEFFRVGIECQRILQTFGSSEMVDSHRTLGTVVISRDPYSHYESGNVESQLIRR